MIPHLRFINTVATVPVDTLALHSSVRCLIRCMLITLSEIHRECKTYLSEEELSKYVRKYITTVFIPDDERITKFINFDEVHRVLMIFTVQCAARIKGEPSEDEECMTALEVLAVLVGLMRLEAQVLVEKEDKLEPIMIVISQACGEDLLACIKYVYDDAMRRNVNGTIIKDSPMLIFDYTPTDFLLLHISTNVFSIPFETLTAEHSFDHAATLKRARTGL